MNNKDYRRYTGCCYGAISVGLLAVISSVFAEIYWCAVIFTAFIIFVVIKLYIAKEDYNLYRSFRRYIASKTVRDKLIFIITHIDGEMVYMRFGTPEEFNEFRQYIENLNSSDDYLDDFCDFLERARKHKRLK